MIWRDSTEAVIFADGFSEDAVIIARSYFSSHKDTVTNSQDKKDNLSPFRKGCHFSLHPFLQGS
jgi:hypothetical protein